MKFCFKAGKAAKETFNLINVTSWDEALGQSRVGMVERFEKWPGIMERQPPSGHPFISMTKKNHTMPWCNQVNA